MHFPSLITSAATPFLALPPLAFGIFCPALWAPVDLRFIPRLCPEGRGSLSSCCRRETKALRSIGACGCSRGAVELFLALVLTSAPTPYPGFLWGRKGHITLEKCSESGCQARGSPSWGE